MLGHGDDVRRAMRLDERRGQRSDDIGVRAEAPPARADHRVAGIGVEIDHGAEIHVEADIGQLRRHLAIEPLRRVRRRVIRIAGNLCRRWNPFEAVPRVQPLHLAAFLIDGDEGPRVGLCVAQEGDEILDLFAPADVLRKQHDAADRALVQLLANGFHPFVVLVIAGKPDQDQLPDHGIEALGPAAVRNGRGAGARPRAAPIPNGCGTERLEAMVGQLILVGFPGDDENDEGVKAVREQLNKGTIGGVVLFPENIRRRKQVKNLIAFLRNAKSNPRPFIAVDQEGGKVQRLNPWNGFKWVPSAAKVARNPSFASPDAAERLYGEMAAELADVGFNMNLGPVVDLNLNPRNPVIGARGRSFGADPDVVTSLAASFIKAHRAANIVTVAKHFPGHGSSAADSHKRLADVSTSWREVELEPYRRLAQDGLLDAVTVSYTHLRAHETD